MDKPKREGEDELGFKPERMIAGEEAAKAGRTRPAEAVFKELRARYL